MPLATLNGPINVGEQVVGLSVYRLARGRGVEDVRRRIDAQAGPGAAGGRRAGHDRRKGAGGGAERAQLVGAGVQGIERRGRGVEVQGVDVGGLRADDRLAGPVVEREPLQVAVRRAQVERVAGAGWVRRAAGRRLCRLAAELGPAVGLIAQVVLERRTVLLGGHRRRDVEDRLGGSLDAGARRAVRLGLGDLPGQRGVAGVADVQRLVGDGVGGLRALMLSGSTSMLGIWTLTSAKSLSLAEGSVPGVCRLPARSVSPCR